MTAIIVTPATDYPVSLNEAKAHLRVTHTAEDGYINALIATAVTQLQSEYSMSFLPQTWELSVDSFPCRNSALNLPKPPLSSVVSVIYVDHTGVEVTMPPEDYVVDAAKYPGRIYPAYSKEWPACRRQRDAVKIQYIAGYAETTDVPPTVIHAIKLMIGHFYENREPVNIGNIVNDIPMTVAALMSPFKQWTF